MAEVTYYAALPFVLSDDGVAAGEAVECLSANAAAMRAEIRQPASSATPSSYGSSATSRMT